LTLVVRTPRSAATERRYVMGLVLGEWLELEYELVCEARDDVSISLAGGAGELLLADVFLTRSAATWLRPESLPSGPLPVWSVDRSLADAALVDVRLPVVAGRELEPGAYARVDEGTVHLGLDIFGSVFFMVSRYEEAVLELRDEHGRFPAAASLSVREGFADRPIVNEYVEVLWAAMRRLWPALARRQRRYRFLPSHDVDIPFCRGSSTARLLRSLGADIARRRDLDLAARRLRAYRGRPVDGRLPRDVCDTYDELMNLSERVGATSVFHFFGERTGLPIDAEYEPSEPRIREVLRRIGERGHEIGLHASYGSPRDPEMLRRQLERLQAACAVAGVEQEEWQSRQHYLRLETPATWRALEEAGLACDSTLGFSSMGGFRAGCCYEFPVYDLQARRTLRLRERPLVAMEVALLDRQGLSHDQVLKRIATLRERCRLFGGDFTLLWHNSRLQTRADRETYEAIVLGPA
jgi:hypothetical protein